MNNCVIIDETNNDEPFVEVAMLTYNHERFVAQAIDSVLFQETTFSIRLTIAEDCSTDNTRQIILDYQRKYPKLIKLILQKSNVGAANNNRILLNSLTGKYIAALEADDFWTDALKLERQVSYLENNPHMLLCAHVTDELIDEGNIMCKSSDAGDRYLSFTTIAMNGCSGIYTLSIVYRNESVFTKHFAQEWFLSLDGADHLILLLATLDERKIYILPETMGVYRKHSGGIWTGAPRLKNVFHTFSNVNLYKSHLPVAKKQLHYLEWAKRKAITQLFYYRIEKYPKAVRGVLNRAFNYLPFAFGPGHISTWIIGLMEKRMTKALAKPDDQFQNNVVA